MLAFILNNKKIQTHVKTGMSLLHFIREKQGLKGTKSGCKEGDCGACTVLVGSLNKDHTISYKSVTSCLTPLANIEGKHVVTIEGLSMDKELNVAQKAIKDNFATQCGFCTPGFVTALTGIALQHKSVTEEDTRNAISGNICRCTGYKSIERAAHDLTGELQGETHDLAWLIAHKFVPDYFKEIPKKLQEITSTTKEAEGVLVGGGTDLYVRHADTLIEQDIQRTKDLVESNIHLDEGICSIKAGTTVSELLNNQDLRLYFKKLPHYIKLISSEQIRNMATLAGNFVNASPIGDLSIFFLALNATLKISKANKQYRMLPLKAFFKSYKKIDLEVDEFIEDLSFELPDDTSFFNFEKVSKRTHLDIASVNSAMMLKVNNKVICETHIALGGVAAIPLYLSKTIRFLKGKELSLHTILEAQKLMQEEIAPISDVRGTEQYKRLLARQLFFAHFLTFFPNMFQLKDFV